MEKIKRAICAALVMLLVLCGCNEGVVEEEAGKRASTGESWTIMIYMCGSDMDEDGTAGSVLNSMPYDLPENVNVVVETGGSRAWQIDDLSGDYIRDFVVQRNGIRLVSQSKSENMGSGATLERFLRWGLNNYPAEHYMTVIWDHGGGPAGGVAYDAGYGFESLSLKELREAFGNVGQKMDIIGFDAGLMSNLETAAAVSLYADYMAASEDVITEKGWDYNGLFRFISENPSASGEEIGTEICDGTADRAKDTERYFLSMAVTDLSKYSTLLQAFDGAAAKMASAADSASELGSLRAAMADMEYLGGNSQWEGFSSLVDLGSIADLLADSSDRVGDKLTRALENAVVYKRTSDYRPELSGLGVFCAAGADGERLAAYRDICGSESYTEFMEKSSNIEIPSRSYSVEDTGAWAEYSAGGEPTIAAECGVDGTMLLTASDIGMVSSANVRYYGSDKKSGEYVYYYADSSPEYSTSESGYRCKLKAVLPMLNGTPVSMYKVSENSAYEIYSIPVFKDGELKNIRVAKEKGGSAKYTILCLWDGVGKHTGMSSRKVSKLEPGNVITPIYEVYGADRIRYVTGSEMQMGFGTPSVTEKRLKDGEYIAAYSAEDIYGKVYESDYIQFGVTKGEMSVTSN